MNDENFIPNSSRTPSELREMTRKGGIASGKARRDKRESIERMKLLLLLPCPDGSGGVFRSDGQSALITFLKENIKYPEQAIKDSIEGNVVVNFNVESDGTITNAHVVKSLHPLLDAEALRVVNLMPKWEPGSLSRYNLPIFFKLN